ncbi:MAG: thiamine phosphate synthase [Bosea sp. (in: a-proteobacteria)]
MSSAKANLTRLMLVSPVVASARIIAPKLEAALAAGDIAAVLLRPAPADERSLINLIKELAPLVQAKGAALVAETEPSIAVRGGADGVHMPGNPDQIASARTTLKGERILGAGSLRARHDAMEAGEAGVDYVMFGEQREDGTWPPLSAMVERAGWWAELFETPCVVCAPDLDSVAALAETGAEFVALCAWAFADGTDIAATVQAADAALTAAARPKVRA